ncbi:MAG: tyrosine-type recombinase/integrase [Candidatus Cloacimonadota bacterium]|nr:tyrosine-type recombinase/integrase [Candidatus Cloacimonadota bacterium]
MHQFLFESGIRPSELFSISGNSSLYFNGSFTYIQGKTKFIRSFQISDSLLQQLRIYRNTRGNFARNFRTYKMLKRDLTRDIFFIFSYLCGKKKLYYFRYLFTLNLLKEHKTPIEIMKALGHIELASTYRYIRTAEKIEHEQQKTGGTHGTT